MATKIQLEAKIVGLELALTSKDNELAVAQQNIRELQKALEQTCGRLDQARQVTRAQIGIPKEVRERFFAANPDARSASKEQILNWSQQH